MKTIKVTPTHLMNGVKGRGTRCAIALAIKDAGAFTVWVSSVGHISAWFGGAEVPSECWVNEDAKNFISDFDSGKPVSPFELQAPAHAA